MGRIDRNTHLGGLMALVSLMRTTFCAWTIGSIERIMTPTRAM